MVSLLASYRKRRGIGRSSVVVFLITLVWGCPKITSRDKAQVLPLHVLEYGTKIAIEMYNTFE